MSDTPSPEALSQWLQVLFYLAGLVAAVAVAVRVFRPQQIGPQPLSVKEAEAYASASEHKQLRSELHDFRNEVRGRLLELAREREDSAEKLHTRINDLASLLGEANGKLSVLISRKES